MSSALPSLLAAVASGLLIAPGLLRRRQDQRRDLPKLTLLCMAVEDRRTARLELRIDRPALAPDWSIRGIEWLAPCDVRICGQRGGAAGCAIETALAPIGPRGLWFAQDPTIWALYPNDLTPPHEVRLRLTLERGGRRRGLVVSGVLPTIDARAFEPVRAWAAVCPPLRTEIEALRGAAFAPSEARSWVAPAVGPGQIIGLA